MAAPLVFVLCPSFHGATLLSILLNSHPDITSLGDTVPTWNEGCACGNRVPTCEFWSPVIDELKPHHGAGGNIVDLLPRFTDSPRTNQLVSMGLSTLGITLGSWAMRLGGKPLSRYMEDQEAFRSAILGRTGKRILADGDKSLTRALLCRAMTDRATPFHVIHLIRDPRGFLASDKRVPETFRGLEASARGWKRFHRAIRTLKNPLFRVRYHAVRYEDLCMDTQGVMDGLFASIGLPSRDMSTLSEADRGHLIGNSMLLRFDGQIRLSTKWQQELSESEAARMLELTAPLSAKFDYR